MRSSLLGLLAVAAWATPSPADATNADEPLVTLHVVDQETGGPIERFVVVPGTPYDGNAVAVWQPHLARESTAGRFEWPRKRTYDQFRLRVEADGYRPAVTDWLLNKDGPQEITLPLIRDVGLAGRIVTPDGTPAAGAVLAIALPNREIRIEGRTIVGTDSPPAEKLGDRWRRPFTTKADGDGRFHLPPETDPTALLVAVHDDGILQQPFSKLAEDIASRGEAGDHELQLLPWGQVSGRVEWEGHPSAEEVIELYVSRDNVYPGMMSMTAKTQSGADGRFTIADVPPGVVQMNRMLPPSEVGEDTRFAFPVFHVEVAPGEPTEVVIGRPGPAVVGRLVGLRSFKGVTLRVHPRAPRVEDAQRWHGLAALRKSGLGPIVYRDEVPVAADGFFRIEGLLPEWYQLIVNGGDRGLRGSTSFILKPASEQGGDPHDLGQIQITRPTKPVPPAT